MQRWLLYVALHTLFVLFFSVPVFSQDVVMVTGEWKPFTSQSMENQGTFTEIVTAVAKKMGVRPHYRFLPWKRCEYALLNKEALAAFPYAYNQERARHFEFSDEVAVSLTRFFYYKKTMDEFSWHTLDDLKPYRIGGVIGYFYEEEFERAGLNVEYTSKELLNLKKLISGRIDLFPVNEWVGWDLIRRHFPEEREQFGVLDKPHSIQGLCLMVRKDDPASMAFLDRFNHALKRIRKAR